MRLEERAAWVLGCGGDFRDVGQRRKVAEEVGAISEKWGGRTLKH